MEQPAHTHRLLALELGYHPGREATHFAQRNRARSGSRYFDYPGLAQGTVWCVEYSWTDRLIDRRKSVAAVDGVVHSPWEMGHIVGTAQWALSVVLAEEEAFEEAMALPKREGASVDPVVS